MIVPDACLSNSAADHTVCSTEACECAFAPDTINTSGLCFIKFGVEEPAQYLRRFIL